MNASLRAAGSALVCGGGGAVGNAWLLGVVGGLAEAGIDVMTADTVIGTSAGATAAAQMTTGDVAEQLASVIDSAPIPPAGTGADARNAQHLARLDAAIAAAEDPRDLRHRLARLFRTDPDTEAATTARWRTLVSGRLPAGDWPERDLRITAIDAVTAEPVVFDRSSGVNLVDAVAASCAGGFVYRIGERGFIDGGYRANADNADLAAGFGRVLVLSPLGGRARTPEAWGTHLAAQVETLREGGSVVEVILSDDDTRVAFGDNLLDPSRRRAVALAGRRQGHAVAGRIGVFWS